MSSSSTEHVLTKREELILTRCMMFGCYFFYDDYGHPERRKARKYHTCSQIEHSGVVGYGYTQVDAAYDWLRRTGNEGDLNVKKFA